MELQGLRRHGQWLVQGENAGVQIWEGLPPVQFSGSHWSQEPKENWWITNNFKSQGAGSTRGKGTHFLAWKTSHLSWEYRGRGARRRWFYDGLGEIQDHIQSDRGTQESWEGRADTYREEWRRLQGGWRKSIPLPNAHSLHVEGQLAPATTPAPTPAGHGGGGLGIQRSKGKT